jgi:DNA-directed RNA polymerase subunit E'/Rpb7
MSWRETGGSRSRDADRNLQLIPSDIRWDPNATPPQFTNNEDIVIEPGTHVRVKIIGTRTEVGEMWAIGSIKEDYLGYELAYILLFFFPHGKNS